MRTWAWRKTVPEGHMVPRFWRWLMRYIEWGNQDSLRNRAFYEDVSWARVSNILIERNAGEWEGPYELRFVKTERDMVDIQLRELRR